jgi:hypothetical protein
MQLQSLAPLFLLATHATAQIVVYDYNLLPACSEKCFSDHLAKESPSDEYGKCACTNEDFVKTAAEYVKNNCITIFASAKQACATETQFTFDSSAWNDTIGNVDVSSSGRWR